jgi:hypothetical protein
MSPQASALMVGMDGQGSEDGGGVVCGSCAHLRMHGEGMVPGGVIPNLFVRWVEFRALIDA